MKEKEQNQEDIASSHYRGRVAFYLESVGRNRPFLLIDDLDSIYIIVSLCLLVNLL